MYVGNDVVRKVHYLNTGCGEDVLHQVLVDPSISLQPLTADANNLWPLQKAHLQLKRHRHLPKVAPRLTLQGIPESRAKRKTSRGIRIWVKTEPSGQNKGKGKDKTLMINGLHSYPFCVKSTFFSGRMERIWLSTWSGFVWLVKVTLYCACKKTQTLIRNAASPLIFNWKIVQNGFKMPTTL